MAAVFALTMPATRYVQMDVTSAYLAAVMFSAWRGGLGAGLLAAALSAVLGAFFFLPPAYSFKVYGEDLLQLGVFTLAALIISSLSAARERALALEQQARRESESANAVKYTPEGGRITLRARRGGGGEEISIEVEDTGQGIRPEDLPHIFDRFYRGRAGADGDGWDADGQEVSGIGLGLHLARVLVEGMGGSIGASFFEHTAREADRFARRLDQFSRGDTATDMKEAAEFWTIIMGEHADFIAHLLDPEESELIRKAMQTSDAFRRMHKSVPSSKGPVEKAVDDIIDFKTAAEKGIQTGKIKSIIHPALADHVRREALKAADELRRAA